jgi:hypothetical protein
MRLTKRGQNLVSFLSVLGFLLVLGFAGWIEGLGY